VETKLYVGNLSYNTTEDALRTLFGQAGTVASVAMITDRDTGSPKGFAFVEMSSQAEAQKAITMFNEKTIDGRAIKVNVARPREERPRSNSGGGGYGNRRY
jgi:RNA recognition motif-containing protein